MFEIINNLGAIDVICISVVVSLILGFSTRKLGTHEINNLKKENYRLRNILADLMIENAKVKNAR